MNCNPFSVPAGHHLSSSGHFPCIRPQSPPDPPFFLLRRVLPQPLFSGPFPLLALPCYFFRLYLSFVLLIQPSLINFSKNGLSCWVGMPVFFDRSSIPTSFSYFRTIIMLFLRRRPAFLSRFFDVALRVFI